MKIDVKTPSGTVLHDIECEWEITRPVVSDRMECREAKLTIARRIPIPQYSIVTATDGKMVKFRGYAESNTIDISSGSKTTWTCKGMEELLNARFAPRYFYPMGEIDFATLFSDTLTDGVVPGLLAAANSAALPSMAYTVHDAATNVIKLAGYGTSSYFGNRDLYSCNYLGVKKLSDASALVGLAYTDNGYYRDSSDLYIRIDEQKDRAWYLHGGLLVENAYDTTVRIGNIYDETQTLLGDLETNLDEIGDLITDLISASNLYLRVRDGPLYTYIDISLEDGNGSTGGLYTIREGEPGFCSIEKSTSSDPKIHGIIGTGHEGQYYSVDDPTYTGLKLHEIREVENGFRGTDGMMQTVIDAHFEARQVDQEYEIEIAKSYLAYPGDYFKFYPKDSTPSVLKSFEIVESSDGITRLSLGGKTLNFADVEEARESKPRGFTDNYIRELRESLTSTCRIFVSDLTHVATIVEEDDADRFMNFYVPPGAKDAKYNAKITLALSLSPVDDTEMWETSTAYVIGDEVYNDDDEIIKLYRCIVAHTSGAITEPGEGGSWEDKWVEITTTKDLEFGRCATELTIDDADVPDGALVGLCIGSRETSALPEIDITDSITTGAENKLKLWVHMSTDYAPTHTTFEDHPEISVSATMKFYKRLSI